MYTGQNKQYIKTYFHYYLFVFFSLFAGYTHALTIDENDFMRHEWDIRKNNERIEALDSQVQDLSHKLDRILHEMEMIMKQANRFENANRNNQPNESSQSGTNISNIINNNNNAPTERPFTQEEGKHQLEVLKQFMGIFQAM